MTGGVVPPGLVTENVSVKHWDATLQSPLPPLTNSPLAHFPSFESVFEPVDGPLMTNVSKSSLS